MPSPINTPAFGTASVSTITDALEHVVAVSGPVNADNVETQVLLDGNLDITNSSSGASVTLKLRRGNGITGATVVTWGPFNLTASNRSAWPCVGVDTPGLVGGQVYSLTALVTSNAGTVNVNNASISVQSQAAS